jgi:uncharacterized membrane protein
VQSIERRRARNWISVGALCLLLGAGAVAFPFALESAVQRMGVSGVAVTLLVFAAISFALRGWRGGGMLRTGFALSVGIPLLLVAAAFSGDQIYLQLVPSAVYGTLAGWFYASLRSGASIVERAARFFVPEAPDFIRSYCRKVTGLWAAFFIASAIVAAAFALAGEQWWWEFFTGKLVYAIMLALSAIEFLVRKTWFRYYFHGGWFDRIWEKAFPPENTAQGRRSMQYIESYWRQRNG